MEPIFFNPTYKNVIWGGNNISKIFKRNVIGEDIGESWELSAHPNGLSIIKNAEYNKKSLYDLFNDKEQKIQIFGTHCENMEKFPILTKFIDANKSLSIQVHPGNEYAEKNEHDSGKTEVWYIMDCKEDAKIVYGFKEGVTSENLENAVDNIEENVNYLPVHKGDFISIPSGTIHAIMEGIVLCEVQQSSDVTYRIYDWNRKDKNGSPRQLHKEKALDVIDLEAENKVANYQNINQNTNMYKSDVFNIDMIRIDKLEVAASNPETFYAYIVIEGEGNIKTGNFFKELEKGDTFLIPANLGKYTLSGNMKLMKISV